MVPPALSKRYGRTTALDAVRGDAERGLLQPLVVRPVGRTTLLAGRLLAASASYVVVVFLLAVLITRAAGRSHPAED